MQFQHTWQQILSGEKTQTRRLIKPGHQALWEIINTMEYPDGETPIPAKFPDEYRVTYYNYDEHPTRVRTVYQVGNTYTVQPGRTQKGVARVRITSLQREDVRNISIEDVHAEGFEDFKYFWFTWCKMHDPGLSVTDIAQRGRDYLMTRPADRYQAWVLTFELVRQDATTA